MALQQWCPVLQKKENDAVSARYMKWRVQHELSSGDERNAGRRQQATGAAYNTHLRAFKFENYIVDSTSLHLLLFQHG